MTHPWDDAPAYMDFEEPMGYDEAVAKGIKPPGEPRAGKKRSPKAPGDDSKKALATIPRLPEPSKPLTGDELKGGISERDRSAVNLRLDGASYLEIADLLEYKDAATARRAIERALAKTHSPEEWDSLRMIAAARAEKRYALSSAMAGAVFLVDSDTGEKIANTEQLRWHQQAGIDLMNWATITGAKAPTKIDITPDEERMDQIVSQILERSGYEEILDADVLELDVIPEEPDPED